MAALQRAVPAGETNDTIASKYYSASSSLLSSFAMMMGGFNVSDFTASGESIMVFVTFMIFVQLVMLNMLIAIMGDSVAAVKAQAEAAGNAARADLIVEMSTFMSKKDAANKKHFPRTFVLPTDAGAYTTPRQRFERAMVYSPACLPVCYDACMPVPVCRARCCERSDYRESLVDHHRRSEGGPRPAIRVPGE